MAEAGKSRAGASARAALALLLLPAAFSGQAHGATTYPQSNGSAGSCILTSPIDTDTGSGVPLGGVTFEAATGTTPALMVVHCTSITIPNGVNVPVTGTRALDLRSQSFVQIDGTLSLAANGASAGPGAGAGGPGGGNPNPSNGGNGTGTGFGGGGIVGSAGGGTGGTPGAAYNGGTGGSIGGSTGTANFGGGGGGAGAGGGFSVGSGGGGGGSSAAGASDGGFGGGGGGAVRIVGGTQITFGSTGLVSTHGGTPGIPTGSSSPFGGVGGGGSGGSQVLIAPTVTTTTGTILDARGGDGDMPNGAIPTNAAHGGDGANGRISISANTFINDALATVIPAPVVSRHSDRVTVHLSQGGGTVTSSPPGINCPSVCTDVFDPDATVTLTAIPDQNASFGSWTGACAGQGAQCVLTSGANRDTTATFLFVACPAAADASSCGSPRPPKRAKCKKKGKKRMAGAAKKRCKKKHKK